MDDISLFGITGMAAIVVCCLLIGMAAKNLKALNDKWIPVVCGVAGAILGAVGMNIMPEFPANDYITAVAVGIVSGLAATGAHQVVKQLTKVDMTEELKRYKMLAEDNEKSYINMMKAFNEAQEELDIDDTFENFDQEEAK